LSHVVARSRNNPVGRPAIFVPFLLVLVAVVVAVDILFFRHQPGLRLVVNIGIVLVFAAFYFRFVKRP
jgi:hypothetical protein